MLCFSNFVILGIIYILVGEEGRWHWRREHVVRHGVEDRTHSWPVTAPAATSATAAAAAAAAADPDAVTAADVCIRSLLTAAADPDAVTAADVCICSLLQTWFICIH